MARRLLPLLILALSLVLPLTVSAAGPMVRIPGGSYQPFYTLGAAKQPVRVAPYQLDPYPVSNAEYLSFVKARPRWRKARVSPIFADKAYLRHWRDDLSFDPALAKSPVNHVSWFAAKAYCQAQGKRLPTVDQWEFAARASEKKPDASQDPAFVSQILSWYGKPTSATLPAVGRRRNFYGVYDLHGLVWEWTRDFNSIMITGESRADSGGVNRDLYCAGGATSGADPSDYAAYMRFAFRASLEASYSVRNLGFRCAQENESPGTRKNPS